MNSLPLNSSLWFLLLFSFSSQLGWSKSFRNTSAALDLKGFSRSVEAMKLLECWNQSWKPWAKQQIRRFSEFCHTVSWFLRYNYIHTTLIVDDDYRPNLADGGPNSKGLYTHYTDYHHWRWYNFSQEKRLLTLADIHSDSVSIHQMSGVRFCCALCGPKSGLFTLQRRGRHRERNSEWAKGVDRERNRGRVASGALGCQRCRRSFFL